MGSASRSVWRIVLLCSGLGLGGCHYWESLPVDAQSLGPRALPHSVEVTKLDGTTLKLTSARLTADSLTGRGEGKLLSGKYTAIPRDSIRLLRQQKSDWSKTAWLVGAMLVGMTAAAAAGPQ